MSKNKTLSAAKSAKNDEFYTQYADIQKEVNAYLDYNPDTFRGKTVLLPCDDPEWSKFTRFFAENFERLGLKKLISTSYAAASKKVFNAETQRRSGGRAACPHTAAPQTGQRGIGDSSRSIRFTMTTTNHLPITSYCSQISIVHKCHHCHKYKLALLICEQL